MQGLVDVRDDQGRNEASRVADFQALDERLTSMASDMKELKQMLDKTIGTPLHFTVAAIKLLRSRCQQCRGINRLHNEAFAKLWH